MKGDLATTRSGRRGIACVGCGRVTPCDDARGLPEGWWADGDTGVACDDEGCQRILAELAPKRRARRPRKPLSEGGPVRILRPGAP